MDKRSNSHVTANTKELLESVRQAAIDCGRDPSEVTLMAVTKTIAPELVNEAIANGIHLLGENRAQELLEKYDSYDKEQVDIHFIGHLQTNKVRQIVDKVSMIHSVDSLHLAQEINRQAEKHNKIMDILVEVNIGDEESKSGVSVSELEELLAEIAKLPQISVKGLMCIPPASKNEEENAHYFAKMQKVFIDMKQKNMDNINMSILSMGMSNDYKIAIQYGSNIVRIGTALFGARK